MFIRGSHRRGDRVAIAACALLLSGCAVGPDYARPLTPEPPAWNATLAGGPPAPADDATLSTWWRVLGDPMLTDLVESAVTRNPGVLEATGRVRQARAQRQVARADFLPTVQASGGVTQSRQSEKAFGGGGDRDRTLYQAGFDSTWEIDLFGGIRRSVEAASADLAASEDNLRDVLVSLVGELALTYVDLRRTQTQLAIAEANLEADKETYQIAQWREQAGLTTTLDVEQARTSLEETRSRMPTLRTSITQAENRLAVLTGEPPEAIAGKFKEQKPVPVVPLTIAVGVPADALRRRPDVRRAERELAAETARVGVATAARYPNLKLIGSIGLEAATPGGLVSAGADAASIATTLAQTVFDFGRISGTIEAQDAVREQAAARYQSVVLTALEDVENAIVAFAHEQERRTALTEATAAAERAALLSRDQYTSGLVDFETVLVAQRSLYSLQDQLAASDAEVTADLIRLYKALGGGWTPEPLPQQQADA
jgi:NodT family efflux transporter outer membrane factor (OMF) lipoprotein